MNEGMLSAEPYRDGVGGVFLTTTEVADRLRTSPETVRYWRHRGEGPPSFKCGRRVLYPAAEFDQWVAAKRASATRIG